MRTAVVHLVDSINIAVDRRGPGVHRGEVVHHRRLDTTLVRHQRSVGM